MARRGQDDSFNAHDIVQRACPTAAGHLIGSRWLEGRQIDDDGLTDCFLDTSLVSHEIQGMQWELAESLPEAMPTSHLRMYSPLKADSGTRLTQPG